VDALWKRALAFDMAHSDVDGMNVVTVHEHVKGIVEQMRKDHKPYFLEALTYRYRGHSVSDPGTYRTKEEVEDYQKNRDPIMQLERYMTEQKLASEADFKAWDNEAKERVKAAEEFADNSPNPPVEELWDHVLVP
jgi:pyruvate dehydrogenase E1 component alpha subunit